MTSVRITLVCAMLILAVGPWAAAQPSAPKAEPAAGPAPSPAEADLHRPVFAHYMTCFANSVEMYKQEIELAQRHGIDGFALNCGEWNGSRYVESAERIYEAARQMNSGFKLFISADGLSDAANLGDMVKRFAAHPNQFRTRGRSVLSAWGGRPGNYVAALEALRKDGFPVCFVPQVYGERYQMAWSLETVLGIFRDQPHMDGVFYFAVDDSIGGTIRTNAAGRRGTQYLGKIFMAGAAPAYNSANLRDFQGMAGYAATWQGIIRDGPDWVELVTWNDYQEDSNLMPFRWQGGWEKAYFDHDESYLDVTGYYSAWFKSGAAPRIAQDKAYFVYRDRSKRQVRAWDAKAKQWTDITLCPWPYDQMHDDVGDFVYVTTFLTAPADLVVTIGRKDSTLAMPAGVAHAKAPMLPGQPHFVLRRGGKVLADGWGRKEIIAEETPENSPVSNRLLNRTWPGAIVAGAVLRLKAESGKLDGSATVVKEGGATAVAIDETPGSGFTVPLKGLATATYNVRITYSNPSNNEARLTLLSDGVPRAPQEHPYFIPAFLPPTGKGKFRTVSFLWSLYSQGTYLSLQWRASVDKAKPEWNDKGSVLVDAIELVKVEPVAVPPARPVLYPELVPIPGGEFVMGAKDGEPDEAPPHKVRISPFDIGKFEVTNEEYEKFDPAHRKLRDGFSWRDREPVIYVSWVNAAQYCNWLSQQAGLAPVYEERVDEKTKQRAWEADLAADGFRLPTEAQWEYVASGRGEGRKYPWGKEPPDAARGNITGDRELQPAADLRSEEAAGTMVVGSYPAGASRDGVMDLAGNVCEWCTDWFNPYTADAAADPCGRAPSNYRSLRGGSWGYYGMGQRCSDREYNNPGYGGYIYIGLRVALPEAGWKKLQQKQ